MTTYTVRTEQSDMDLGGLLSHRLSQCGCVCGLATDGAHVSVTVQDASQLRRLAEALTMLLCRDLQYFEMARMTDALPLSLQEKQAVLAGALQAARESERPARVRDGLAAYLETERSIHLDGYLRFRMRRSRELWQDCVERMAAEQVFRREYHELMGALNDYMLSQRTKMGELSICINPDGSCTLTDDSDARIEYVDCSDEGIISLLVGMSPSFLTVYDLSGGPGRRLTEALVRVFGGRVKVFR